jgi:hypothetical protein
MALATVGFSAMNTRILHPWFALLQTGLIGPNALINFFPVHDLLSGSLDADSDLIARHAQDGHGYIIADHQALSNSPR